MDNDFDGAIGRAMQQSYSPTYEGAIKTLQAEIEALKQRVVRLENQVDLLKKTR